MEWKYLFVIMVVAGCGGDENSSTECINNHDCDLGKVCTQDKCLTGQGHECEIDIDCGPGKICLKDKCMPDGSECLGDEDCEPGETCQDGKCISTPECIENTACDLGKVCTTGQCAPGPGHDCEVDSHCSQNETCQDGKCVSMPECIENTACDLGKVCTDGQCAPGPGHDCETDAQCGEDEICQEGSCVPEGPAEGHIFGELALLRQIFLRAGQDDLREFGKAEAGFREYVSIEDNRPVFRLEVSENDVCRYGLPPEYDPDIQWPPELDAGYLTFKVDGAPGDIVMEPWDSGEYGTAYFLAEPDPLTIGYVTYADFFHHDYLPFGAAVSVTATGGSDLDGFQMDGAMTTGFTIVSPEVEESMGTVSLAEPLQITWENTGDPPSQGSIMDIFITVAVGMDVFLLDCQVADDGEALIPMEALVWLPISQDIGIQLRRNTFHKTSIPLENDKKLYVRLTTRLARVGSLYRADGRR